MFLKWFIIYGGSAFILLLLAMVLNRNLVVKLHSVVYQIGGALFTLLTLYTLISLIFILFGGYSWHAYWNVAKYGLGAIFDLVVIAVILKRGFLSTYRA
jgi:hypothetical protein